MATASESAGMTMRTFVRGDECPEGIFYPRDESISSWGPEWEEWKVEALASAAASWRAIGLRPVVLAKKFKADLSIGTAHALRTNPRGYGAKKKHFKSTTECGKLLLQGQGWDCQDGLLRDTQCLSCRKVVRERYELHCEYEDPRQDEAADEYDRLQEEAMWEEQRRFHHGQETPQGDLSAIALFMARSKLAEIRRAVDGLRGGALR